MNILVTGANGQLGNEMQIVSKASSKDKYIFTDVCDGYTHLDITNIDAIRQMVKDNDVKCIINCAAWTNVDKAETAGEIVETLNATAPENLAKVMKEVGGLLVHISTDYVFGGDPYNTPCREDQKGILRTAWLYSEFGHNFVKTMLNLTATHPQLKVVFDQCGTPTYAGDLANTIFDIVENRKYEGNSGIYHFSNEGVTSWYDFTKAIAALAGHDNCNIQPCHSDEFPSPVKRPAYSVLDKTKIKETFHTTIPYWLDSLKKCMANMNEIKK